MVVYNACGKVVLKQQSSDAGNCSVAFLLKGFYVACLYRNDGVSERLTFMK